MTSGDKSDAPDPWCSRCECRRAPAGLCWRWRGGAAPASPPPTLCSSLQSPGSRLCLRAPGPSAMANPGRDMELSRLVQDQPPGQVAPSLAPPNLVEHLPNVPSYRPPITRIPVLVNRRTALSNSSFAKQTRSSVRRLGSVTSPAQHERAVMCASACHGLLPARLPWSWHGITSWAHRKPPPLPLLINAFILLCADLRGISPLLSVPLTRQLAIHFFGLNVAFCRSSFFYTGSHSYASLNKSLRSPGQEAWAGSWDGEENKWRGMEQKKNVGGRGRQSLLTLRVCWELDFLRTVDICPANSTPGKERPPGVDRLQAERRPQGNAERGPVWSHVNVTGP